MWYGCNCKFMISKMTHTSSVFSKVKSWPYTKRLLYSHAIPIRYGICAFSLDDQAHRSVLLMSFSGACKSEKVFLWKGVLSQDTEIKVKNIHLLSFLKSSHLKLEVEGSQLFSTSSLTEVMFVVKYAHHPTVTERHSFCCLLIVYLRLVNMKNE